MIRVQSRSIVDGKGAGTSNIIATKQPKSKHKSKRKSKNHFTLSGRANISGVVGVMVRLRVRLLLSVIARVRVRTGCVPIARLGLVPIVLHRDGELVRVFVRANINNNHNIKRKSGNLIRVHAQDTC